jgi:hypothetical protein
VFSAFYNKSVFPAVCQIELPFFIFGKNVKTLLLQFGKTLYFFGNLGKTNLQHVNICARLAFGIIISRKVGGWKKK